MEGGGRVGRMEKMGRIKVETKMKCGEEELEGSKGYEGREMWQKEDVCGRGERVGRKFEEVEDVL